MYVSLEVTESQIVPEMHYMYTSYSLFLSEDTKNHQKAGKKQEAGGEESSTTFADKTKAKSLFDEFYTIGTLKLD